MSVLIHRQFNLKTILIFSLKLISQRIEVKNDLFYVYNG